MQHSDLKVLLKEVKLTADESRAKRKRRMQQGGIMSKVWSRFIGQFQDGRRVGWGTYISKQGDQYSGNFEKDKMHGRGQYWFSNSNQSILYVGEFHENDFQGLGKMIFADNSAYFGSFIHNHPSSKRGVVQFANGDKYKGVIEGGKRTGQGEYWFNGDKDFEAHYEGDFYNEKRDGKGTFKTLDGAKVVYRGQFRDDKRCGECEELSVFKKNTLPLAKYTGTLNADEQMHGEGSLEIFPEKTVYKGEFKENKFDGKGQLTYDDKSTFDGVFQGHMKHGPASLTLENGRRFEGEFKYNTAVV